MTECGIESRCGTCDRVTRLVLKGAGFSREYAQELAAIMDGTSPIFVHPPKADRSDVLPGNMGRCSACAYDNPPRVGVFKCTLFGYNSPRASEIDAGDLLDLERERAVARPKSWVLHALDDDGFCLPDCKGTAGDLGHARRKAEPIQRTSENSTTTDGKPPAPAHEDSGAPQPIGPNGQHGAYWVLKPEERAKGFVRPVRFSYRHVGRPAPKHPLRDLTEEEKERYTRYGYVKFEPYGVDDIQGKFWKQRELDSIDKGCGGVTSMSRAIAETYARSPSYYGATFCATCGEYRPVGAQGEFIWDDEAGSGNQRERVGT